MYRWLPYSATDPGASIGRFRVSHRCRIDRNYFLSNGLESIGIAARASVPLLCPMARRESVEKWRLVRMERKLWM
jgi:hypothetical protein